MTSNEAAMNKNYAKKIKSLVKLNNFSSSDNVREVTISSVASYHSVYYRYRNVVELALATTSILCNVVVHTYKH